MFEAIQNGDLDKVKYLIEVEGDDINNMKSPYGSGGSIKMCYRI
jgi:hypothetical protein